MTHINYRNQIEKQLVLYIEFLPTLAQEKSSYSQKSLFKLLDEIQYLKLQIQRIDRMTMSMALIPVAFKKSQKKSQL